ncbi:MULTISPECIES: L,D-transpeptidase family protein [Campylobacter]|uniref:L,D-transpeptidase family protein n=1 Tax=Campylobacter TaxID=194 RepID=UPI000A344BF7|nr:L,D-transpeptidase family protein [Campylobacter sp. P0024]MCR8679115.1 L,D-transpeptidase family protein [Campylobacter sp. RM19072]
MKKLLFLLVVSTSLFSGELEELYLKGGISAVQDKIEKNLQSVEYWSDSLKNKELKYGYHDDKSRLIIVADKTAKNISVNQYEDGKLKEVKNSEIITGLMGEKLLEGDLKTPVGVYDITRRFTPPTTYYGPVAFSLSYPNLYDKLRKRTGYGIWIHGYPMEGDVRENELETKGCIAMKNDILESFEDIVQNNSAIVIISEDGKPKSSNLDIAVIFAQLFAWKDAWTKSDLDRYIGFYHSDFRRFDGMKLAEFTQMKKRVFSKNESKIIEFQNFNITPYPNTDDKNIYRVNFSEKYRADSYKFNGDKTLYVEVADNKMKILVEE